MAAKQSSKKKTTNSRGKNSKQVTRKSTYKKSQRQRDEERREEIRQDVILGAIIVVSVILFASNLQFGGVVGNAISNFLFGLFGLVAYVFPFLLVLGAFFYASNRENDKIVIKLIAFIAFLLLFCLLLELITYGDAPVGPINAFLNSFEKHVGGGLVGGLFAFLFIKGFGLIGAYAVTAVALLICVTVFFDRSMVKGINKVQEERNSEEYKKEREERRNRQKEQRERRAEELRKQQELKRTERRFNDVDIENTALEQPSNPVITSSDEINEIKINCLNEDVNVEEIERVPLKSSENSKTNIHLNVVEEEKVLMGNSSKNGIISENENFARELAKTEDVQETQYIDEVIPSKTQVSSTPVVESKKMATVDVPNDDIANKTAEESGSASGKTHKNHKFPPLNLLNKPTKKGGDSRATLKETADKLQQTLVNFGVDAHVTEATCGPAVTRFEIALEPGVKVSKILNLADDIQLNLAAADIRIEAPIPGKSAVGIEVPNKESTAVYFRELMESSEFKNTESKIAFAAGRDIGGQIIISDIAKMPHVLIAGATGSGKSVCINTIIMSILYHANPDDVKFIMIDPKVVELSVYNGIPHLLIPVVTDPKKAAGALQWAVNEMTDRYNKFAEAQVRDMKGYNSLIHDGNITIKQNGVDVEVAAKKMPQIVVIVDELADLMMVASSDVEASICRLAQLARAAGIHLVIATQRPSVNVITGLIKANMPSRIAFAVSSQVDSRTILDIGGAEKLLGKGDMLYFPQGFPKPLRVQGAFVSDDEVKKVVDFLKKNNEASYDEEVQSSITSVETSGTAIPGGAPAFDDDRDQYFEAAGRLILEKEKGSIGMLQRNFKIGFNRAARIMDQLEDAGIVGPEEGTKPRRILVTPEEFEEIINDK